MAEKQITVSYGALKLQALEFYMKEEGNSIEAALKEQLDKLYQKNVPKQVQEFLEKGPLENGNVQDETGNRQVPETQSQEGAETVSAGDTEQEQTSRTTGNQSRASARNTGSSGRSNRNRQRQSEPEQTPAAEEAAETVTPEETEQEETGGMAMSM